nr:protein phosphatase 2C [Tanacetum cinerariifolium]
MEDIRPSVSVAFSLGNSISEKTALGMKILTETATILSDPMPVVIGNCNGVVSDDIMVQESDADETMSVGDEPIEV